MNKKHKKIGLFGLILGSLIKILFFTKKKPKPQRIVAVFNSDGSIVLYNYKDAPEYIHQTSDQEYVEVDVTDKQPNFTHPNDRYIHPNDRNEDDVIRSPDGSA